ncbi:MAG: hypothetical protein O7G30_06160, partial [Proteobacteria bacterium]|nr:hypothetical protein [Pseudomonadota bacterium]
LYRHHRADPGYFRPLDIGRGQPIRSLDAGNLVTWLLGLGPIPGSAFDLNRAPRTRIAHADFDDQPPGDDGTPNAGPDTWTPWWIDDEMGFTTTFTETQGPGSVHTIGVFDAASTSTSYVSTVFRLCTVDAETTFDFVDISRLDSVIASLELEVSSTGWEGGDFFLAELENDLGAVLTVADLDAADLDAAEKESHITFSVPVPAEWDRVRFVVSGRTDAPDDAEFLSYDTVALTGDYVLPPVLLAYTNFDEPRGRRGRIAQQRRPHLVAGSGRSGAGLQHRLHAHQPDLHDRRLQ